MKATLLLCDYVALSEGKLYISGAGWSVTGPGLSGFGIALKIDVPWDLANHQIPVHLRLLKQDGEPVMQAGPAGPVPVEVLARFEVGRPPGIVPGSTLDTPLALNFPPIALAPGERFYWELEINGQTHDDWTLPFSTRGTASPSDGSTNLPGPSL